MSTAERRPLSTYLLAALLGLIGAVLGFILTGFVADTLLAMSGMPDREGYRAMIAFFTFAPFGGLVGLLGGIALVLRRRGRHRGLALAGRTALTAAALAAVASLSVWAYLVAGDDVLAKNGPRPSSISRSPCRETPSRRQTASRSISTPTRTPCPRPLP